MSDDDQEYGFYNALCYNRATYLELSQPMPRYLILFLCLLSCGTALAADSSEQLQRLIEQQQFSEAARNGEKILLQQTDNSQARFLTAYAYQMSAQHDRAIQLYQQLIRDHPSLPEPRNNLAMIHLARGDYDLASQLLVEAINTHSSYATAYENLSQVYKGIASEAYRRAVSESSEPAKYTHDIKLTAITTLDGRQANPTASHANGGPGHSGERGSAGTRHAIAGADAGEKQQPSSRPPRRASPHPARSIRRIVKPS